MFAGLAAAGATLAAALVLPSSSSTLSPMPVLFADSLNCNLSQYKAAQGLTAAVEQDTLLVSWSGQNGADLRARYAIDSGQPVVRDLAVKKAGGQWTTLGKNLTPEYHVVTGIRRMADDQANPLKAAGIELTEEVINKNRWYAFWDSPLVMPGSQEMQDEAAWRRSQQAAGGGGGRGQASAADSLIPNRTLGTPRTPSEIRRADSSFQTHVMQREDRRREPGGDVPRACRWGSSPAICSSPSTRAPTWCGWTRRRRPTNRGWPTSTTAA